MDTKLIDSIVFDGIDTSDYPDFSDAYISHAEYDGVPMNDEALDIINDDRDFVYEQLMKNLF